MPHSLKIVQDLLEGGAEASEARNADLKANSGKEGLHGFVW